MCGWGGRGCEGQSTVQDEGGGRPRAGGQGGREERGEDRAVFRWPRQPDQLHHDPLEDGAGAQGRSSAHSLSPSPSTGAGTSWGRGAVRGFSAGLRGPLARILPPWASSPGRSRWKDAPAYLLGLPRLPGPLGSCCAALFPPACLRSPWA